MTGGLAGDDDRFEETWVWHNERIEPGLIVLCGFYGDAVRIGYGSLGGWDTFGPDRVMTQSNDNILYQLDNQSALELYKQYLGDHVKELPASALLIHTVTENCSCIFCIHGIHANKVKISKKSSLFIYKEVSALGVRSTQNTPRKTRRGAGSRFNCFF